ncbi:MAG: efflux RND transporter periplasmic adaptor subunit, partial [bacterium]|nr:efflux RND transporter periplasmic adaptor subunit [bacterium]
MRHFERLRINRLVVFWGLVLTMFAGMACTGPEKEQAQEHDHAGEIGQVATVAHAHEKVGETCFICDPAKRDKGRLWCNEHARYEDRCWLCHPELEDTARLYCKEHSLYEDECFLCHPELKAKPSSGMAGEPSPVAASSVAPELFCNEHGVPEMECGICQPQLASGLQPGKSLFVRLPSLASAEKAGIRTGFPLQKEHEPGLEVLCETQYNKNTMMKVTPLTNGIVQRVLADVGDRVFAGDVLVELHSAEVASAKSAYLSALVALDIKKETRDREKRLVAESISAQKDYLEAEANFRLARLEGNHT